MCYTEIVAGNRTFKKVYGNINRFNTIAERKQAADVLISILRVEVIEVSVQYQVNTDLLEVLRKMSFTMRPKSISTYRTKLLHFGNWLIKNNIDDFRAINADLVLKYFDSILIKQATTYNSYVSTIKTILRYAHRYGFLKKKLILDTIKRPEVKCSQRYFRSNEMALLKEKLQEYPMQWMATQLLFYCFIRPGEMRELKVGDIDVDRSVIVLRGAISKNKKTQSVVIPNQFLQSVKQWIHGLPQDYYMINKSATPLKRDFISKQHRKILHAAGYGKGYSFYSWKHTGAVQASNSGIHLKDLQMQLRHHSLDMVNEYLKQMGAVDSIDLRTKYPTL